MNTVIYELSRYDIRPEYELSECDNLDDDEDVIIPTSYPAFKVREYHLGFYTSLAKSELAMTRDIKNRETEEDPIYCYHINEYLTDCCHGRYRGDSKYSRRSYLPDGSLMDANLTPELDSTGEDKAVFSGRTPERIRFRKGDFVEILYGNYVELGIVYNTPPSAEHRKRKMYCELDYGDDSYLILSLSRGDYAELSREDFHPDEEFWTQFDSHSHPLCIDVFPPRFPIPEKLRELLIKMNQY
jgi:hypothetical protein